MSHREVVEFGDVTVDLRRLLVLRRGQPVSLEPKTFDVLRYLIDHRDRLVSKEELLDTVWKDTFVTPNVLTRAVAQLRKGLGDDAFQARYIETAAKRGYRFIAVITSASSEDVEGQGIERAIAAPEARGDAKVEASWRWRWVALAIAASTLAGLLTLAVVWRSTTAATSGTQPSLRRFTTGSHSYAHPAVSADGRTVAFSSDRSGSAEIYTVGFAPGDREIAITNDGGQNTQPAWSPDGQWIAYHSRKKRGIWIVPAGGGVSRQVVDFGSQPAWMPDSQQLVFTSDAGGMAAQSLIWLIDRNGSGRRKLTNLGAPRGGHSRPSVSRDGRLIAFTVSQGFFSFEAWIQPVDAGPPVRIGPAIGPEGPQFSDDGSRLFWVAIGPEGNDALMTVSVDRSGTPVGVPSAALSVPGNIIAGLTVARNGTSVLSLARHTANLFSVDVQSDGTGAPPVQITFDEVRNTQPRFSRAGRLAVNQFTSSGRRAVWSMNDDGSDRQVLTVGLTASILLPQWTPDGTRLFAISSEPDRSPSFAFLDVATRRVEPIATPAAGVMNPNLSPDGQEIAFHRIDKNGVINVWRQRLDGGPARQLTFDSEAVGYPVWSHDGRSLAVEVKRGDTTRIGVMSSDGGPVEELVAEQGQNWPSGWSPDDTVIAFAGERDGVWNIYTVSRASKQVRRLTPFTSMSGYVRYPAWSPVRPRIVFERAEHRGSLWTTKLW